MFNKLEYKKENKLGKRQKDIINNYFKKIFLKLKNMFIKGIFIK